MITNNNSLKYPRRKRRSIKGKSYKLVSPNEKRSMIMSKIGSKNTSIENNLAKSLRKNKIKYRSGKKVIGKPDFILLNYKVAIFCDGDFWHGYNLGKNPIKTNAEFWKAKIGRNIERDKEVNRMLKNNGWKVFRFWEHDIKKNIDKCIKMISSYIIKLDDKCE